MSGRAWESGPCNMFHILFPPNRIWIVFVRPRSMQAAPTRLRMYRCVFDPQLYREFHNGFGIFLPHGWRCRKSLTTVMSRIPKISGFPTRLCRVRTKRFYGSESNPIGEQFYILRAENLSRKKYAANNREVVNSWERLYWKRAGSQVPRKESVLCPQSLECGYFLEEETRFGCVQVTPGVIPAWRFFLWHWKKISNTEITFL